MKRVIVLLSAVALLAMAVGIDAPRFSNAAFTSTSSNVGSTFTASSDWTPPSVSLAPPASPLTGIATLTATATDPESGIASVVVEYVLAGSTSAWTRACTLTASPFSCAFDTRLVADGTYDVRATATDTAGNSATSEVVRTVIANAFSVVLASPGDAVRGTVALATTLRNAGTTTFFVRVEYAIAGSGDWKPLCSNLSSPYTCSWNTTSLASGFYDLRSVAFSGGFSVTSGAVLDVLVDNTAPTVTMANPGSPLRGVVTFSATATDTESGVATVDLQYAVTGSPTFTTFCSVTTAPYSCSFNTASLANGTYAVRAVATDSVGNVATSAIVTNRVIDNTVSSVSLRDPGPNLRRTITLTANAAAGSGVASVTIQRAPAGSTTWSTICSTTASPYSCPWNSASVADGLYDFRAVLVDGLGRSTTSATVSSRQVDNIVLRGADIQAVNGSGTAGRLDAGDVLTYTFSDAVSLSTVSPGWDGSSVAVSVRLQDGNLIDSSDSDDTLTVLRSGSQVNLGSVNLRSDFIRDDRTAVFSGTMVASTTTVGGVTVTVVRITLGSVTGGGNLRTNSSPAAAIWTPSALVTDSFGNACSTTPVTETGTADRDF